MARVYSDILDTLFSEPLPHASLNLIKHIRTLHPNSQFVPTVVSGAEEFPLAEYLAKVLNIQLVIDSAQSHIGYEYDGSKKHRSTYPDVIAGIVTFPYKGVDFQVYKAFWQQSWQTFYFYGLIYDGPDDTLGQELMTEIYRYANDLKEEIWVYDNEYWSKNKELYKSIKSAKWDDVVLKEEFKEGLRRDTETFFQSKEIYQSLGITWKRGILLLGPPGNGKTESIKALVHEFGQTTLYVKSFTTSHGPEYGVRQIFNHARKHSPCILILEDLDSMVTPKVRSFLLNELDGLAQNDGILTIATTNHPERIDDAILNRPSRFDVKYDFTLPEADLRKAFAMKWIKKLEVSNAGAGSGVTFDKKNEEIAEEVSQRTEGWSFAFLKELFVSFLLRIAHDNALRKSTSARGKVNGLTNDKSAEALLFDQIEVLSAQILKKKEKDERKKRRAQKKKAKAKAAAAEGGSEDEDGDSEEDSDDAACDSDGGCCRPPSPDVERPDVAVVF